MWRLGLLWVAGVAAARPASYLPNPFPTTHGSAPGACSSTSASLTLDLGLPFTGPTSVQLPPFLASARVFFLLSGSPWALVGTAVSAPLQDRLWVTLVAGGPEATGDPLQPCPGLHLSPLNESEGVVGVTRVGVTLSGTAPTHVYASCLRRLTYTNLAAFPCPPSPWDGVDPRVVRCQQPSAQAMHDALEGGVIVPGSRVIQVEAVGVQAEGRGTGEDSVFLASVLLDVLDPLNAPPHAQAAAGNCDAPLQLLPPAPPSRPARVHLFEDSSSSSWPDSHPPGDSTGVSLGVGRVSFGVGRRRRALARAPRSITRRRAAARRARGGAPQAGAVSGADDTAYPPPVLPAPTYEAEEDGPPATDEPPSDSVSDDSSDGRADPYTKANSGVAGRWSATATAGVVSAALVAACLAARGRV